MKLQSEQIKFDYQGHRGCRGLMPENTIAAMLKAIDLNVTTLEMDVVISADNKVVVSHEAFFNAEIATAPNGKVINPQNQQSYNMFKMNYDEIKLFDVGLKPHKRFPIQQKIAAIKPLLSELIDSVENYLIVKNKPQIFYNIEIKSLPETDNIFHPSPNEFSKLVMDIIQQKNMENRCIVQSFDVRTLQYIHANYPKQKTALLVEGNDKKSFEEQLQHLGYTPTIYSPYYALVNAELVATCKSKGIKIVPWTVNDLPTMKRLKVLGVNGIISDYPNFFNEL